MGSGGVGSVKSGHVQLCIAETVYQLSLTLSLTLTDLNLTIFPSIPCLVSGRQSEPIIIFL